MKGDRVEVVVSSPSRTRCFVVMSGLPASGKSTLGRELGHALGLSVIDKDTVLEELFDSQSANEPLDRNELSRNADEIFKAQVQASEGAIVISFWRRVDYSSTSGTPIGWLADLGNIVEVHCSCNPAIAASRFAARSRHSGHGDDLKYFDTIVEQLARLSLLGPLGVGKLVEVRTDRAMDLGNLALEIRNAFAEHAAVVPQPPVDQQPRAIGDNNRE